MIFKEFYLDKEKDINRRLRSTIQHKLRVTLKCYTVYDFSLNEIDRTYSFKRSDRIYGVKMNDDRIIDGRYEVEILDEETAKLSLFVG